ncbi:MAG: sensor histidine kinase, partial [Anaerolineae bacterium]
MGYRSGRAIREERAWESLQGTLTALSLGAAALAYVSVVAAMSVNYPTARWDLMAGPSALGAGAILTFFWRGSYRARAWMLLSSMFAAAMLVNRTSTLPQPQMLYAFICLVAGLLLGPWAATAVAVLGTGAILGLAGSRAQVESMPWNLAFLWLAAGVMWVAMANITGAIRRSEESEAKAWHYARQANERRGELARAKKTLSDLYDLLQRTNHELAVAREEAEEARQIKAQFAANISHELRTPLNLILGFSEMMYRSPEVYGNVRWTPALSADIHEIYQASRHLSGMIDDILDLSRIESHRLPLRLEPTDMAELIREAASTASGLLRGKDVTMQLAVASELPELVVDRMRIRQVLLNLLNNAIRFTDRGEIKVLAEAKDGEVMVAVSDTGLGIPPEDMKTIFEEFGQARSSITGGRGGAGLGLTICRQFVHLHGGRIEADSTPGEGSTFRFYLPLPQSGRARSRLSYYSPEGWSPPVPENPLGKAVILLGADAGAASTLARNIEGYRTVLMDSCDGLAERVDADHPAGVVLVRDPMLPAPFSPEDILRATGRPDLPLIICEVPVEQAEAVVCRRLGLAAYLV